MKEKLAKWRETINGMWGYVASHHNIGADALQAGLDACTALEEAIAENEQQNREHAEADEHFNTEDRSCSVTKTSKPNSPK